MPLNLETELTRARALSMSLKQMLVCAQDLEDKHQPVGCAIFLADELDYQLERIEDAARGWIAPCHEGGERLMARERDEGLTPEKLRGRPDALASMNDALEILSRVAEDEENYRDRCRRVMGALAYQIFRRPRCARQRVA